MRVVSAPTDLTRDGSDERMSWCHRASELHETPLEFGLGQRQQSRVKAFNLADLLAQFPGISFHSLD